MHPRLLFAAALLAACSLPARAADIAVTWDGANGHWDESAHWGLPAPGYPDNNNGQNLTYAVTVGGGVLSLGSLFPTVDSLAFTGGNISGSGAGLSITSSLLLEGDGTTRDLGIDLHNLATSTATLSGTGTFTLGTFVNEGTLTATGGAFAGSTLSNSGALLINAPANEAVTLDVRVSNTGSLHLQSGNLAIGQESSLTAGALTLAAGTHLTLTGAFSVRDPATISGEGDVTFSANGAAIYSTYGVSGATTVSDTGRVTFYQTAPLTFAALNFSGDQLTTKSAATANGLFTWSAGRLRSEAGLTAAGGLAINSSVGSLNLDGSLTNAAGQSASFAQTKNDLVLYFLDGSAFTNAGAMTFYGGTLTASYLSVSAGGTFRNTGTFTLNAPGRALLISDGLASSAPMTFINQGTVHLVAGTLNLAADDDDATSGTFQLDAGTALNIGAAYTFTAASAFSGAGNLDISNNARNGVARLAGKIPLVSFSSAYDITGDTTINLVPVAFNNDASFGNLSLTDSTLSGTGDLTINEAFAWSRSNISVASIHAKGTVSLALSSFGLGPQDAPSLIGTAFTIDPGATFDITGGGNPPRLSFLQGATLTNNGALNVGTSMTFAGTTFNPTSGHFVNNATLNLNASFAVSATVTFDNAGTINVNRGTFTFVAGGADSPSAVINVTNTGTLSLGTRSLSTGKLNNDHILLVNLNWTTPITLGGAGFAFHNAGQTVLFQGTLTVGDAPTAQIPLTAPAASTFVNTGTVELRGGTLILFAAQDSATTGVFTVGDGATLEFAADYSFALATDPTLTGVGTVLIDSDTTLTLAIDSDFTGTIIANGTLIIAPPRDPTASPESLMQFTILPQPVPEPSSLAAMALALLPLLLRRRP
jgi:hypothetical protein